MYTTNMNGSKHVDCSTRPGPEVINLFSCSNQLGLIYPAHKCSNAINCRHFNTFSKINTTFERLKARKVEMSI